MVRLHRARRADADAGIAGRIRAGGGAADLLDLLASRGIKATWFVPGVVIDSYPDAVAAIVEAGHEIGHHGYSHTVPASMPAELEEAEMLRAIDLIARATGRPPAGYRSPAWDLSPVTLDLLIRHGFVYDSSMMADDWTPYRVRSGDRPGVDQPFEFGQPTRLIEMPISWSLDDYPHFEYSRTATTVSQGLMNAGAVLENWLGDFTYMTRHADWGALTYTCHPFVTGRGHRMLMLEQLIDGLEAMGAEFLTLESAAAAHAGTQTGT